MDFQVLGPLLITDDRGAPLPVPQPLRRAVLALLLVRAGRPGRHQALIESLWPDAAPRDPVRELRSLICKIRADLAVGDRLTTLRGGYQLTPLPGELDLDRFWELSRRGELALAAGQLERAARLHAAALDQWRDPPLADLPASPAAAAEAAGLLAQRRVVETRHIDLLLALGQHREVIPELRRIVAADQLAEHSWAQLIRALYGAGRKAEALAAYSEVRRITIDRFGTEPGKPLRRLSAQILADGQDHADGHHHAGRDYSALPPVASRIRSVSRSMPSRSPAALPNSCR